MPKSKPATSPADEEAYAEFMSRAYTMELEAVERYAQFADALETHNNREVAQLFRKLSEIESLHAKRILAEMRWPSLPALPAAYAWESFEGPETAPFDAVHYLMQPYHALEIALRCEQQARKYYEDIAAGPAPRRVKLAAKEMAAEEAQHVALIQEWMKKVPQPAPGWDEDPDPPRMND
jgi:rubrerythrin